RAVPNCGRRIESVDDSATTPITRLSPRIIVPLIFCFEIRIRPSTFCEDAGLPNLILTQAPRNCGRMKCSRMTPTGPARATVMRSIKRSTPGLVLALLCAMSFLYFVDRVASSTAAPLMKADLGISNTQLGLAFSAFAVPYAVFQLLGG